MAALAVILAGLWGSGKVIGPSKPPTGTPPVTDTVRDTTRHDTSVTVPPIVVPPPSTAQYVTMVADSMRYANTKELLARISSNVGGLGTGNVIYTDGPHAGLAVVDDSVQCEGHNTIAYKQAAGSGLIPEMWVAIPPSMHIWLRAKIRFGPGWSTKGSYTGASAYKLLGWGFAGYYGSGRLEISNVTQYQLYWGITTTSNVTLAPNVYDLTIGNITNEWTDGNWYNYVIEVDHSAGKKGVARTYIGKDGGAYTMHGISENSLNNGANLPPINYVNLGMNFNQQQRAGMPAQQLNYCRWEVVDGSKYSDPFQVR